MENKKTSVMKLPAAATNYSKPNKKKNLWTPEEDLVLKRYVETHGEGNWATVSQRSGLKRGGKSCRLRWKNYLRPNIKRGDMSQEEQDLILRMHKLLGNRWSLIAGRLPGRTDNEVKNYWNTHLNKMISSCCPPGSKRKTTFHAYSNHQHHHQHNTSNKKNKIITIPNTSSTSPSRDPITINSSTAESKKDVDDQNHVRIGEPKGSITNEETTDPWNPAYILLGENHTANTAGTTTRDTFYYDDEDMIEYSPRVMHYCQFLQPSTNDVNATFGFDDEPFIGYMDSFIWV